MNALPDGPRLGRFNGLSIHDYHRNSPGVSKTALDQAHRSIAHWLAYLKSESKSTPALVLGEAFHTAVLEPAKFEARFACELSVDRRTKAGKEQYAEWLEQAAGRVPLSADEMAAVEAMRDSVLSHPTASALLAGGDAEDSFFWQDESTGLLCKTRPDYYRMDRILLDLKSAIDASYEGFRRAVASRRYHVQGAMQTDGVKGATGEQPEAFVLIAVEKEPPYAVGIYHLDDLAIDRGREEYKADLEKIAAYKRDPAQWTGYPAEIQTLYLPPWA